jgi:RimJ/RimL family protein N-acetyltransferase
MNSIKLRPLTLEDAGYIYSANTGNVRKYFMQFKNIGEVNVWIADTLTLVKKGEKKEFVIFNQDNEFIGMIAIWNKKQGKGEISIWIKESAQRRGYAKLALETLLSKYSIPYSTLEYMADADNLASIKLAQSAGFRRVDDPKGAAMYKFEWKR